MNSVTHEHHLRKLKQIGIGDQFNKYHLINLTMSVELRRTIFHMLISDEILSTGLTKSS